MTPSRNLSQRLVLYALSAGAVAGVASVGAKNKKEEKEIKSSGPVEYSGDDFWFDLQNEVDPTPYLYFGDDFKLFSGCNFGKFGFEKHAGIKGKNNGPDEKSKIAVGEGKFGVPEAIQFHAGDSIGTQTFFFFGLMDAYGYNANTENFYAFGRWQPGDRGFLGLKLIIDCDKAYYGWADVTLNTLDCEGGPVFTLHRYAYNTEPNENIYAGQTKHKKKMLHLPAPTCTPTPTATPTPTIPGNTGSAIGLLIAGAAGIASLKERRR